jgi:hypothetical protein
MPILWFVCWVALWQGLYTLAATAQHTHEGAIGEFYQTWKRPYDVCVGFTFPLFGPGCGRRTQGCCDKTHCQPISEMRRRGDGFEVRVKDSPAWFPVRNDRWEDAQPDPRESPDGQNHVCIFHGEVICAVRGSGQ